MCELKFYGCAWKIGKSAVETSTYGIWSRELRDFLRMCFGRVTHVQLLFDEPQYNCVAKVTEGYWNKCPELKHRNVKKYLASLGALTWTKREPPRFELELTKEGCRIKLV